MYVLDTNVLSELRKVRHNCVADVGAKNFLSRVPPSVGYADSSLQEGA